MAVKRKVGRRLVTPELTNLLDELEIRVVNLHRYRGPGMTMATACLESIIQQHGYAHLKLVLMSISETANNQRELVAPVIWAVSDLIRAHPKWADRASEWFEAFDKVDIRQLRAFAKQNKAVKPRAAIATLLFGFLKSQMDPAEPVKVKPDQTPRRMAA